MKNHKYRKQINLAIFKFNERSIIIAILILSGFYLNSCQKEFDIIISKGEPVELSVSDSILILNQKLASSTAISFNWTRGTNQGTGSSISYTLEIDQAGSNFTSAQSFDIGKGVFEKSFTGEDLNDLVVESWGIAAGSSASLESRVTAHISDETIGDDISDIVPFSVTTFKPVSEVLYIVGSASPNGNDITSAIELISSESKPWEFVYQDKLTIGNFKFTVSQDECWCQDFYTKDPTDDNKMVYNVGGVGDDNQWSIEEDANYKITVDLLDLTIIIQKLAGPGYENLYIVGDASPSGWDIATPEGFTPSMEDPYIYTYEGTFSPGEFKISTFTGDWCDGEWINPSQADQVLTATDFIITQGCDGPDNTWRVTDETKGRYKITVNLFDNTILIERVMLYLIGDGGPNGWNIATPEPMSYADGVYTFSGELGAINPTGEFKFSKFTGNWCDGEWILATSIDQSLSVTDYMLYNGCPPDEEDYKWRLVEGDAGNYVITINLDTEELTIIKQ